MTGGCRVTFIHDLVDAEADGWLRNELLPQLLHLPEVQGVRWFRRREVPQPDEVSRPLNAVAGMGEVDLPRPELVHEVLSVLESSSGRFSLLRAAVTPQEPEYDLLRDTPHQHLPYLSEPVRWSTGSRPEAGEPTGSDLFRYMYFFRYRDDVTFDAGEDWYLGHHTREGKQLPGLVRYRTWRRQEPVALRAQSPLLGFVRFTELCFESFDGWYDACYRRGPRWRMPEGHPSGVWTDYHAFFVGPEPDVDLLPNHPAVERVF